VLLEGFADELYDVDFTRFYDSSKISGATNIGILDGPAEDGTRSLRKAHDPKVMKPGNPLVYQLW
jgi:hypothetical protein